MLHVLHTTYLSSKYLSTYVLLSTSSSYSKLKEGDSHVNDSLREYVLRRYCTILSLKLNPVRRRHKLIPFAAIRLVHVEGSVLKRDRYFRLVVQV